jgi:hypothetical protein
MKRSELIRPGLPLHHTLLYSMPSSDTTVRIIGDDRAASCAEHEHQHEREGVEVAASMRAAR